MCVYCMCLLSMLGYCPCSRTSFSGGGGEKPIERDRSDARPACSAALHSLIQCSRSFIHHFPHSLTHTVAPTESVNGRTNRMNAGSRLFSWWTTIYCYSSFFFSLITVGITNLCAYVHARARNLTSQVSGDTRVHSVPWVWVLGALCIDQITPPPSPSSLSTTLSVSWHSHARLRNIVRSGGVVMLVVRREGGVFKVSFHHK